MSRFRVGEGRVETWGWTARFVGALVALHAAGCGDDAGGTGGGGTGGDAATTTATGDAAGLRFTGVIVELKEPLASSVEPPIAVDVNVDCPSGDCGAAAVSLGGVALGSIATLAVLEPSVAEAAAAVATPGGSFEVTVELDGETASTTVTCPGEFDVVAPADGAAIALGGPLPVTWSPFAGAYSDQATSCFVQAYLFDQERTDGSAPLGTIDSLYDSLVFVGPEDTSATITLPAASELAGRGPFSHVAIGVSETGPVTFDDGGGTVQCVVRRYAVGPRGD